MPSSALREICLLKELKHKNIVRYVDQQDPPCLGGQLEEVGASEMGWADHLWTCLDEPFLLPRLHDVLHSDKKLTLVFEFCDQVKQGLGEQLPWEGLGGQTEVKLCPFPAPSSLFRTLRNISTAAMVTWTLKL